MASPRLLGGAVPPNFDIDGLASPEKMVELLYRTKQLSDEAFEEIVNDIGYRAALLVLRAKAIAGDVKALDLYLRLVKESKREREAKKDRTNETRNVTPSSFLPQDRALDPLQPSDNKGE